MARSIATTARSVGARTAHIRRSSWDEWCRTTLVALANPIPSSPPAFDATNKYPVHSDWCWPGAGQAIAAWKTKKTKEIAWNLSEKSTTTRTGSKSKADNAPQTNIDTPMPTSTHNIDAHNGILESIRRIES